MRNFFYNKIRVCLLLFLILNMTSCMIGKKYERPELNIPTEILQNEIDSIAISDLKWWELYSDEDLQNLIQKAINNNKDVKIAAARVTELAELKRINTAKLLPQLGVNIYGDREWENYGGNAPSVESEFGTKITMNWEVDLWGNLRWAKQQGIAEYLYTLESQRALQMTLVSEVAKAYFELVALDNELNIVRQTFAAREEAVRQAKLRFEGGLTSETSYQQSQVELANTATLIPGLVRRITMKQNEIALLCGEYPNIIKRGAVENLIIIPENLPENLTSELLKRRPDVRAAEQSLISANAAVGMTYTDRFPRIKLTGTYGLENDQLTTLLQSPYGLIIGSLTGPVFEFNGRRAKYRAQQAVYQQECANFEKVILTVFKEASNAIVGYNSAREARERKEDLEQATGKYVELANLQYLRGVINYFDVLDAQRNHFEAQIGLSNAIRDEYIAIVELYKAFGGGWE